jgi:hypothetical protein
MSDLLGIQEAANSIQESIKAGKSLQESMGQLLQFAASTDRSRYAALMKGKSNTFDEQRAIKEFERARAISAMKKQIRSTIVDKYGSDGLQEYDNILADIQTRRRKADKDAARQKLVGRVCLYAALIIGSFFYFYL